jgi:hypothetical protein
LKPNDLREFVREYQQHFSDCFLWFQLHHSSTQLKAFLELYNNNSYQ